MRIQCKYCSGYLEDTDVNCPNCNAPNDQLKRSADGIPKTIEELKTFATEKGIPLTQMRFFIDYDMREPRAYGIYKDEEGNFVVYKNKSNGERAVRYKGSDEAYAVNEIYQKLRTEMAEQKMHQAEKKNQNNKNLGIKLLLAFIIPMVLMVIITMVSMVSIFLPSFRNAGNYNGSSYYDYGNDYGYDNDYDYDYDSGYDNDYDDSYDDSYDDWDDDWDDDDWDYDYDWDDSYSDWDSDW